jgi:hypothetical protein
MMRLRRGVLCGSAAALTLLTSACGPSGGWVGAAAPSSTPAPDSGYRAPPEVLSMGKGPEDGLTLTGRAMPSSQVRLASPGGAQVQTTADGSGVWSVALGPVSEPTLYGLSAEADGRRVQAEGYVAVLPGGPTVALLRAGAGAQVLGSGQRRIQAVDYDGGGAAVVSGRAGANAPLRLIVDGAVAMEARAGADGRFSLTLPGPLPAGAHRFEVATPKDATGAQIQIAAPEPPAGSPYQARPEAGGGWRIDWITPGGGPQTTLLLPQTQGS